MKTFIRTFLIIIFTQLIWSNDIHSQSKIRSGFDPVEFNNALCINAQHMDSSYLVNMKIPKPMGKHIYRSEISPMENCWDFWIDHRGVGIISLRGTAPTSNSWLENFYAAMVPAIGELIISNTDTFRYKLAESNIAYVHAGWLIGLSSMGPDIVSKIKEYHKIGITDFIIVGHSQGGALAFLLRSYLEYLPEPLPNNVRIKTYAAAAPKPGNLHYAYDYDFITRNGWGFRIINPLDWVPEMPFSIQRLDDMNSPNPFEDIDASIKNMTWVSRKYVKKKYNKMDRSTKKAQETYTDILGDIAYKFVKAALPETQKPTFVPSFNYMTCGIPIILQPQQIYYDNYVNNKKEFVFMHHGYNNYLFLLLSNYPERD